MKTAEIIYLDEVRTRKKMANLAKEVSEAILSHSDEARTVYKMKTVFAQWVKLQDQMRSI